MADRSDETRVSDPPRELPAPTREAPPAGARRGAYPYFDEGVVEGADVRDAADALSDARLVLPLPRVPARRRRR